MQQTTSRMRIYSLFTAAMLGSICLGLNPAFADVGAQKSKLHPTDGTASDLFGSSVAISGTIAIVGTPFDGDNGSFSGSAYTFDALTGSQIAKLLPSDGAAGNLFGRSVAISGTAAIAGAENGGDNGMQTGSAYLFEPLTGLQTAKLIASDGSAGDKFGISVAISGTTAIVGAPFDDDNGSNSGSVYLFDTLTGVQLLKVLPSDGAFDDEFGWAVAISGSTAIVGAPDDVSSHGSAYLIDVLSGAQIAKLIPNDGAFGDRFGSSVAISGTTVIVGAAGDDDNGSRSGSAYLFDTITGVQIAKLLPSDGAASDEFGASVAISGSTAIGGAFQNSDNGSLSGSAYFFDASNGVQTAKLLPSDGASNDRFGFSVAISGLTAIVGAQYDDDNGIASGAAYLFETAIQFQSTAIERNGSGHNASILSSATGPTLGLNFVTDFDCSGHGPSIAILEIYAAASNGLFLTGGELLVDLASPLLISVSQAHTGGVIQYSLAVPSDPSLCGLTASIQGIVFGAPHYELSNALDIVVGI